MRGDLPGVYTSMPAEVPDALHGRDAVVVGASSGAVDAVLRLAGCCRSVTYVTERATRIAALRGRANISILYGSEIVCVDGIEHLESVVLRRIRGGGITARCAAALFLINESNGEPS